VLPVESCRSPYAYTIKRTYEYGMYMVWSYAYAYAYDHVRFQNRIRSPRRQRIRTRQHVVTWANNPPYPPCGPKMFARSPKNLEPAQYSPVETT
jgi:hypothetical protein